LFFGHGMIKRGVVIELGESSRYFVLVIERVRV
jgi:hypothetical protein